MIPIPIQKSFLKVDEILISGCRYSEWTAISLILSINCINDETELSKYYFWYLCRFFLIFDHFWVFESVP